MSYARMGRRTVACMACVMGLLAALLAGASGAQAANTTTLSFTGPAGTKPALEAVIEDFNRAYAKQGIRVEGSYVAPQSFGPLLLTQFQANNAPDLFVTQNGGSSPWAVWRLAAQGKLLDLSRSSWVKHLPKRFAGYSQYKGRTYSYHIGYLPEGMMYNRSLWKSMKLKFPTTFSQLLSVCRKVAGTGKIPIAYAAGGGAITATIFLTTMTAGNNVYSVNPKWTLLREKGRVKFATSPEWRTALQQIIDMKNAKCFPPSPAAITLAQQDAMMATGQALMTPSGTSEIQRVKLVNPQVPLGLFALPAPKAANTEIVLAGGQLSLAANAATSHAFAAKQFINYMAKPNVSRRFAELFGVIPSGDISTGVVSPALRSAIAPMARLFKAGKVRGSFNAAFGDPSKGLFSPGLINRIPGLMTGQESVQSILQWLDTTWDSR